MATNLTISSYQFIGIHKVCPHETDIVCLGQPRTVNGRVRRSHRTITPSMVTHEVHYVSETFAASVSNIMRPGQDVGMLVWFGAASAVNRPSHSKVLLYLDDIYYLTTYTDILGPGHGKQCDLHRIRDGKFVNFLQIVSDPGHKQLILDRVMEAWGSAWSVKNESEC